MGRDNLDQAARRLAAAVYGSVLCADEYGWSKEVGYRRSRDRAAFHVVDAVY